MTTKTDLTGETLVEDFFMGVPEAFGALFGDLVAASPLAAVSSFWGLDIPTRAFFDNGAGGSSEWAHAIVEEAYRRPFSSQGAEDLELTRIVGDAAAAALLVCLEYHPEKGRGDLLASLRCYAATKGLELLEICEEVLEAAANALHLIFSTAHRLPAPS